MTQERYCCVTIDTEPDCTVSWRRSDPLRFTSVTEGIPSLYSPLFSRYGVKPVYFVSPEVAGDAESVDVLRKATSAGRGEIGNHLHAEYVAPEKKYDAFGGTDSSHFLCSDYSDEVEYAKLLNYDRDLAGLFGVKPVSYRAARYGADAATIRSLAALGYRVDSSVTPGINWAPRGGPDFRGFRDQPYFADLSDFMKEDVGSGFLEVPVTIGGKRFPLLPDTWLAYAWLRPTHMSVWEMKRLVDSFLRVYEGEKRITMTMMFHSMEPIPRATPFVRSRVESRWYMGRLEGALKHLAARGFSFVTLAELYGIYSRR